MPGVGALRPDSPPTSDCQKARRFLNSLEAQMLDLDGSRHSPTARAADRRNKAAMSALPPKADMCGATWDVRFGPKADICNAKKSVSAFRESRHSRSRLFNHLIGQIKNVLWDPNGLAILGWKVSWPRAFNNPVYADCSLERCLSWGSIPLEFEG